MTSMSVKQAKALGLIPDAPRKARTTRKAEPRAGAESRCVHCPATFTSDAAETRHVEETHHSRFESVVT